MPKDRLYSDGVWLMLLNGGEQSVVDGGQPIAHGLAALGADAARVHVANASAMSVYDAIGGNNRAGVYAEYFHDGQRGISG